MTMTMNMTWKQHKNTQSVIFHSSALLLQNEQKLSMHTDKITCGQAMSSPPEV
jgi:hypothetical protein